MMSTRGSSLPSIENRSIVEGRVFYLCLNGDENFNRKKYVLNPRAVPTFDAFLDDVGKRVPCTRAIRRVYTPSGGHRITDFNSLESDRLYVCGSGSERFKRLDYTQIPTDSAKRQRHRNHYRNRSEDRIVPARHNKTFENIQPKYNTVNTQSCKISVFLNREYEKPPLKVTLDPHQQSSLDEMKKALRKKCEESFFRFHKLYTLDGRPVDDVRQIEPDGYYVAVDQYSKFEHGEYAPHGIKPLSVPLSPRYKFTETKYLWKDKSSLNGPVNGRHRTLPPIESKKHSPDHSVSSYPETRKRNQVNGVPVKAAKHTKRTPGKQADYDKDDGGVFKAKGQNKDTRGAREVRDTGDTKVDLPIDQVRAEEVKDEKIRKEKQNKETNNRQKQADTKTSQQNGERSQGVKGDTKATANSQGVKGDTKASTNNSQNSTFKSNSKAPPQQASNNSVKNDTKKDAPPKQDDRNFNNNDPMRASTPNDAGKKSPAKDNKAPSPSDEHKAATKIQANYRGHQARKEVNDLKQKKQVEDQKKLDDAAKSKQLKQENEAATKIQAGFRGHQARKEVQAKKQVRDDKNSKEEAAATKIQSGYRGHRAREEIKQKKTQRTEKNTEEEAAAIKIQAGFRGHKARQDIKEKKQRRNDLQKEEEKAATKIQAGFRGHQARKEVQVKKQQRSQQEEEEKAATKIQAGFRGHQARKEVAKKKSKRLDGKTDAVTLIQAVARGFLVRRRIQKRENTKQLLHLRSVAQEEVMDILGLIHERDKAATKIQSRYRGYRDRKKVNRIKVNEQRAEALLFLQANVRAFFARKDINKRLVMDFWRQDNPVNRLGYVDSIDKVQAAFHGYLCRKLAFVKLHQMLKRSKAVNVLQACFKAYIERWHMQRRQATNLARYHKAASDLQTGFQGFLTRRCISAGMSKRNNSATKIQTGVRGYFARKSFLQQKHAVTRIQSGYRGFKAKQQYEALAYERKNSAATKIQSHFRGYNIRKNVQLQARQLALELLLSGIRGYILRKEMTAKLISANQKYEAAVKIQSQFRCYSQKNKYETLKIHHRNEVWLNRSKAATRVQAHFRGYLSRKRLSTKTSDNTAVENEPIFVQGTTVNFDVMTSRNTMPRHAGRRQATMSNVSREQTYVINGEYHDGDHQTLASSPRSSRAYVDSFSLLQESFRSLLSRRKKSTKLSQSFFRDRTRFIAASHLQASIKAYMTRSVIRRLCQLENAPIAETSSLNHPTPPPFLKNPNEIKNSGSFEEQIGTTVDSILPAFMEETAASNHHHQSNEVKHDDEIAEEKVQYVIRNKSADRNHENQTPVQYLYRSRESTKYKTPVQTDRSPNQDDEQSLIERNNRIHRFEEPSPPIRSARSPTRHLFDKRIDEISPDIRLRRYEEPSPLKEPGEELGTENSPNDEYKDGNRLFEDPSSHNHENFQIDLPSVLDSNIREDMDTHRSRFEEPSPVSSDPMNMDIEYPTSSRDKTDDLPSPQQIRKHSDATRNSHDSELSIETFSRRIVNEIQNNAILKEESLLILQAAFRGFLLRNKAYSKRLQKISKMDTDDKSIFDETTATFLHAGVKGFLSRHRELASPPEM